jgi:tetratricopeptide (TPR) repeat protein
VTLSARLRFVAVSLAAGLLCSLASPATETIRFVVFPMEDLTKTPSLAWIGEGLAISLSDQLEAAGFEAVDRDSRISFADSSGLPRGTQLSRASMIRIARGIGADRLVFGSYSAAGEEIRIAARVLDVRTIKLGPELTAAAPVKRLADAENDLAWQIVAANGVFPAGSRDAFRLRMRAVPNDAFACYVRSLALSDADARRKLLLRAVELSPAFPQALFRLGKDAYKQGDCAQAIEPLDKVPEGARGFPEARFIMGSCKYASGDFDAAIRSYAALLPFGERLEVENNLGAACLRAGDLPQALRHLAAAHALGRNDAGVTLNLAIARQLQGDDHAAQLLLEGALRANPGNGMLHYLLSRSLDARGLADEARRAVAEAARAGVDPEQVKNEDPRVWVQLHASWATR